MDKRSGKKQTVKGIAIFLVFLFAVSVPLPAFELEGFKPFKVPKFPKNGIWLNTTRSLIPSPQLFSEKLTLVYFWDYNTINCLREMRILKNWAEIYRPYGLQMIWVHTPEFESGKNRENVENALRRMRVRFPVVLDNNAKIWESFGVKAWPTKFLVDETGKVVYTKVGEGEQAATEETMRRLLQKLHPGVVLPEPVQTENPEKYSMLRCGLMSGETYLGYKRSGWWGGEIANKKWVPADETVMFKDRGERVEHGFFANGNWTNKADYFEHARETSDFEDYLGMIYAGAEVYAKLERTTASGLIRVYVTRDGLPVPFELRGKDMNEDELGRTYFLLEEARLYYLIANEDDGLHELRLWVRESGVAVNSFSFSNRCLSDFDHL